MFDQAVPDPTAPGLAAPELDDVPRVRPYIQLGSPPGAVKGPATVGGPPVSERPPVVDSGLDADTVLLAVPNLGPPYPDHPGFAARGRDEDTVVAAPQPAPEGRRHRSAVFAGVALAATPVVLIFVWMMVVTGLRPDSATSITPVTSPLTVVDPSASQGGVPVSSGPRTVPAVGTLSPDAPTASTARAGSASVSAPGSNTVASGSAPSTTAHPRTGQASATTVATATATVASSSASVVSSATSAATVGCAVTYKITNSWSGAFAASLAVGNTGSSAINGWTLTFTFPGNQKMIYVWGVRASQSGEAVTLKSPSYSPPIRAGSSVTFGFQAIYSGTNAKPGTFKVNGMTCTS